MNEHLSAGEQCFRIIREHEKGPPNRPGVKLTQQGGALNAYLCPANKPTISFGVRKHPDGRPVVIGDTITPTQVEEYLAAALRRVEADVRRVVTAELTQFQFDAVVSWVYNLGVTALVKSSDLLNAINSRRWADAAVEMCKYVYTSSARKNDKVWYRALFGLFLRRSQEACVVLGFDWSNAVRPGDLDFDIVTEWQPEKDRFYDQVPKRTPFLEVLRVAQQYPLDTPQIVADAQPPVLAPTVLEPVQYVPAATADTPLDRQGIPVQLPIPREDELLLDQPAAPPKADAKGSPSVHPQPVPAAVPSVSKSEPAKPSNSTQAPMSKPPAGEVAAAPSPRSEVTPLPPPKLPDPPVPVGQQTSAVDATRKGEEWSHSAKSMIFSRRFWGLFLVVVGRLWMLKTGSNAVLGTVSDPLVMEMFSGFMVMILGELVQHWGGRKATRPLK